MRQINITLDLYSALISAILFLYLFFTKGKKDKLRIYFMLMCVFNFAMSASDITNWAFEGLTRTWYPAALWAGSLLYYLCSGPLILAFTLYTAECIAPRIKVWSGFWRIASALCGVQALCSVLSLWNGMYFTVAAGNTYQRGSCFWFSQIIPLLIYVIDIAMMVWHRHHLQKKDFMVLFSYISVPLIVEVIQMLNYGIALLSTATTLSILLMFINIQSEQELRLAQQEKELTEARINLMCSQIQPHFLYNTLTTIRQLCDINPMLAKESIRNFSYFLRANMDSLTNKAPIPFEQELKHTEYYLNVEQQRFQSRLHIIYEITARDFSVPPLTLQPIVENAVRHGVLRREEGGTVTIHTKETPPAYQIIVSDDGLGFPFYEEKEDGRIHVGITNVRKRLSAMCGGTLDIQSTAGGGTIAAISIPKEGGDDKISCG